MAAASVDQYTFHIEPVKDVPDVCRKVKEAGMKVCWNDCIIFNVVMISLYSCRNCVAAVLSIILVFQVGLALKPGTDVQVIQEYVDMADMVLVMTVEPGFGGQSFMSNMMPKVKWLREHYPTLDIEVDGGVGPSTISSCAQVCL